MRIATALRRSAIFAYRHPERRAGASGGPGDVHVKPAPNAVERWQMKRKIDVRAHVRGRDLGSVVRDVKHRWPA